jgi:MFS family permease
VPQIVVAVLAPWIGRQAVIHGRWPLLVLGFAALPIRGALLAVVNNPEVLVAVQLLDGISAAVLAVLVPLIIADVTRGTGHFNLAQGLIGTAVGVGASASTALAGYTWDYFGIMPAFLGLAALAAAGFVVVMAFMPETGGLPQGGNKFGDGALFQQPSQLKWRRRDRSTRRDGLNWRP